MHTNPRDLHKHTLTQQTHINPQYIHTHTHTHTLIQTHTLFTHTEFKSQALHKDKHKDIYTPAPDPLVFGHLEQREGLGKTTPLHQTTPLSAVGVSGFEPEVSQQPPRLQFN